MKFIQDDDFKKSSEEQYQKVANSLLQNKWVAPFYVWQDEQGDIWCVDGKRRETMLHRIKKEGGIKLNDEFYKLEIPDLLPALFIEAPSLNEAAKLVLLYSSTYGEITQDGLHNFLQVYNIAYEDIKFEINIPDFSEYRFEQKFDVLGISETDNDIETENIEVKKILVVGGDLFQLGNHLLYCGNSLDPESLKLLFKEGEKARILCTDPPYNLPTNYFQGKGEIQHQDFAMGAGELDDEGFVEFLKSIMLRAIENTVDGAIHYIFMDFRHGWHILEAARRAYGSPTPKQKCIWKKDLPANGSFYRAQYEECYIFKNGTERHLSHLELKDRFRSNVWEYAGANSWANPDREREGNVMGIGPLADHPTPKNTQMIADIFLDTTNEGDIVLELFSGSGSAIIAGEKTNRKVYAAEIEPKYVQSTIIRYINYCQKNQQDIIFAHINGSLKLEDFKNNGNNPE